MKDKRTGRRFFYINTHLDHIGVQARINGLQLVVDTIARLNKDNSPVHFNRRFQRDVRRFVPE